MLNAPTLYWDPAGPHYIYGRAMSELGNRPAVRHDRLEPVVLLVPVEFVAMYIPEGSPVDTVWKGITRGVASFSDGRDPLPAAWLQGPGLYRVQAGGKTLFVYLMPLPGKWEVMLVEDEETGRASLPSDTPAFGREFVVVPSVLDLVP